MAKGRNTRSNSLSLIEKGGESKDSKNGVHGNEHKQSKSEAKMSANKGPKPKSNSKTAPK